MSTMTVAGRSFIPAMEINNQASTRKALIAAELTAIVAQRAFDAFLNKKFEDFDALVGENACQIRASLILDLAKKCSEEFKLVQEMQKIIERTKKIQEIVKTKLLQGLVPDKTISFEDFCKTHELTLEIPRECEFLLEACLLTVSRSLDPKRGEFTNPENLITLVDGLPKNFLKQIILRAQKSLSFKSVEHLKGIAKNDQRIISDKFVARDDRGIQGLPGFFGMEVLMQKLIDGKNPILIVFKQKNSLGGRDIVKKRLLFRSNGKDFDLLEDIATLEEPAFVIEGTFIGEEPNIKKIKSLGLKTVVLANVAQHPQFFGKKKFKDPFEGIEGDEFKSEKERFLKFKKLSDSIGCSITNPSLFFMDHILSRSIRRTLEGTDAIGRIIIPAATGAAVASGADGAGAAADANISNSDESDDGGDKK